jgi:hypothetical protein
MNVIVLKLLIPFYTPNTTLKNQIFMHDHKIINSSDSIESIDIKINPKCVSKFIKYLLLNDHKRLEFINVYQEMMNVGYSITINNFFQIKDTEYESKIIGKKQSFVTDQHYIELIFESKYPKNNKNDTTVNENNKNNPFIYFIKDGTRENILFPISYTTYLNYVGEVQNLEHYPITQSNLPLFCSRFDDKFRKYIQKFVKDVLLFIN